MSTGAKFAVFKNKMLLGYEDLGTRMLDYLKQATIDSCKSRWDVDGAFNSLLTLGSSADNTVSVGGTSTGTDGLGHILDVANIFSRDALFENTNAIVYYVAMFYAEIPHDVRTNPRDGKPQYAEWIEEIGRSGQPTSVVDNGNGTITFNVNSVTEAGVTNAGRTVRVYKNLPADGALTAGTAIEELEVDYSAGNNTITTAGMLGQNAISTTASDYTVVLMGLSVSRGTDLSSTPGAFFLGTVTGNGAGETPTTFDTSGQAVLKPFTDATQVLYDPTLWLIPGPLTVQQAFDNLLSGLLQNGTGDDNGTARVGINPTLYTPLTNDLSLPDNSMAAGIGNTSDLSLPSDASIQDALVNIDLQLQRVRSFTTYSHGWRPADWQSSSGADATLGQFDGLFFMRRLGDPFGDSYEATGDDDLATNIAPYFLGESAPPDYANLKARPRLSFHRDSGLSRVNGKYQRVYIDAPEGEGALINYLGTASGGIFEDVVFHGTRFSLGMMDLASDAILPMNIRNSVVDPGSEVTQSFQASLYMAGIPTNSPVHGLVENTVILGPESAQVTPAPLSALYSSGIGSGDLLTAPYDRPMKYHNCLFINQRVDTALVYLTSTSTHKLVFDNCHFFGISGQTVEMLILGLGSHVIFRDCVFYGEEGSILKSYGISGMFENCIFITGTGGTAIDDPQIIDLVPTDDKQLGFKNCTVFIGTSAIRDDGTLPLIKLGDNGNGHLMVDGLYVKYIGGTDLHNVETVYLLGNTLGRCRFRDIQVDLGDLGNPTMQLSQIPVSPGNAYSGAVVGYQADIEGIRVYNARQPSSSVHALHNLTLFQDCRIRDLYTQMNDTNVHQIAAEVNLAGDCNLKGFRSLTETTRSKRIIWGTGDSNSLFDINLGTAATPMQIGSGGGSSTVPGGITLAADENSLEGFKIYTDGTGWNYELLVDGRDSTVANGSIFAAGTSRANPPIKFQNSNRRNKCLGVGGHWDGTTYNFILLSSDDSLVDNITAYRHTGATTAVNDSGSGNTVGAVINSTAL